jgi:hypothetical protein
MKEGAREWSVPSFSYYAGRKHDQLQTAINHYECWYGTCPIMRPDIQVSEIRLKKFLRSLFPQGRFIGEGLALEASCVST